MIDRLLQLYAHAPEHPAKLRIFAALHRLLRGHRRLCLNVGGGLRLRLDPDDHIERCIIFADWHEELTARFLLANLRPGETALVAGAHIGYHVMHAVHAVGPTGRVLTAEPEPVSLLRTLDHLRLNGLAERVTIVGHALGDETCYLPMADPPAESAGTASLLTAPAGTPYHAFVDTIDHVLTRLGIPQLDFLQLDIEGFERRALLGLGARRPRIIVFESDPAHHERLGEPQGTFFKFVRDLGYRLYSIGGQPVSEPGYYPETNLVAVRTGEPDPVWPRFADKS